MIYKKQLNNNAIIYITDLVCEYDRLLSEDKTVIPLYTNSYDYDSEGKSWPFTKYAVTDLDDIDNDYLYKIYQRLNNEAWTILSTANFVLREMKVSDVPDFYRIYGEPGITDYISPLYSDIDEEIAYTRKYIEDIYPFYGYGLWTVVDKSTNKIVGRAGLSVVAGYDLPDLGFVLSNSSQHKGYCFEICSAILDYAKNELGFNEIQARVVPSNTRSINLLKRLGFIIPHIPHQGYLIAHRTFS